jgi:excisionase family DNA binding protein
MGKLLSAQQAAEHLGVSIWTVARLARSGQLTSVQIGRRRLFAEEDLQTFVRQTRQVTGQVRGARVG